MKNNLSQTRVGLVASIGAGGSVIERAAVHPSSFLARHHAKHVYLKSFDNLAYQVLLSGFRMSILLHDRGFYGAVHVRDDLLKNTPN